MLKLKSRLSGWNTGERIALAVLLFVTLGPPLLILIVWTGQFPLSLATWAWREMGGNSPDSTQVSMARAAWAGIVVGAITIILLGFTLFYSDITARTALIAVEETRSLTKRQIRAYVGLTKVRFEAPGFGDEDFFRRPPIIELTFRNTGQSPAKRVRMRFAWTNEPSVAVVQLDPSPPGSVSEIAANVDMVVKVPCPDFKENNLSAAVFADVPSWVIGWMEYEDVFGEQWITAFRRELRFEVENLKLETFVVVTADGNMST